MGVGLFNIISAIFVDACLTATREQAKANSTRRLQDKALFARNVYVVIEKAILEDDAIPMLEGSLAECLQEVSQMEIEMHAFEKALKYPEVRNALANLDILEADLPFLEDILDPQNDMKLSVWDIVNGLRRLRGDPRRSDIVTVDLMVREIQERVNDIFLQLFTRTGLRPTSIAAGGVPDASRSPSAVVPKMVSPIMKHPRGSRRRSSPVCNDDATSLF